MNFYFDQLDSFEVHEVLQPRHEQQLYNKVETMTSNILQNLIETNFYQSLRNNYTYFKQFGQIDLKELFKTAQIFRVKKTRHTMVINFNQPTVCVLVYGQIHLQEKHFKKGEFFIINEGKAEMFFNLKTTLIMLHKDDLENKLYTLENYYYKKKQIEHILPLELLQICKKQVNQLVGHSESLEGTVLNQSLNKKDRQGLFLLFQGNYAIKMSTGIVFTEISYDYFGQEILWKDSYQFSLEALTQPYRFIFIPKTALLNALTQTNLNNMKQLYEKKFALRKDMIQQVSDNLSITKTFIQNLERSRKTNQSAQHHQLKGKIMKKPISRHYYMQKDKQLQLKSSKHGKTFTQASLSLGQKPTEQVKFSKTVITNFRATLYKDQRAQSQRLFRKKTSILANQSEILNKRQVERTPPRPKRSKTQGGDLDNLPKSISTLMKYYDAINRMTKGNRRQERSSDSKIFLASPRERRMVTNLKLNKQTFLKEYFQTKSQEDKAFKTWR